MCDGIFCCFTPWQPQFHGSLNLQFILYHVCQLISSWGDRLSFHNYVCENYLIRQFLLRYLKQNDTPRHKLNYQPQKTETEVKKGQYKVDQCEITYRRWLTENYKTKLVFYNNIFYLLGQCIIEKRNYVLFIRNLAPRFYWWWWWLISMTVISPYIFYVITWYCTLL